MHLRVFHRTGVEILNLVNQKVNANEVSKYRPQGTAARPIPFLYETKKPSLARKTQPVGLIIETQTRSLHSLARYLESVDLLFTFLYLQ